MFKTNVKLNIAPMKSLKLNFLWISCNLFLAKMVVLHSLQANFKDLHICVQQITQCTILYTFVNNYFMFMKMNCMASPCQVDK